MRTTLAFQLSSTCDMLDRENYHRGRRWTLGRHCRHRAIEQTLHLEWVNPLLLVDDRCGQTCMYFYIIKPQFRTKLVCLFVCLFVHFHWILTPYSLKFNAFLTSKVISWRSVFFLAFSNQGPLSPAIFKNILCLFLQDLLDLNVTQLFEWLNHMV